jgi:hypothetical protein
MATKSEMNKILLVIVIFVLLFTGLIYVRILRQQQLEKAQKTSQTGTIVQTTRVPEDSDNGVIRILPVRTHMKVGDQSTFSIQFEASGHQLDGADVSLSFDPSYLDVIDLIPGAYFSQYPRKTIDNVAGTIKVTAFTSTIMEKMASPSELCTIIVKARKAGNTQIMLEFVKGKTTKSNLVEHKTSKNILGMVEHATVIIGE